MPALEPRERAPQPLPVPRTLGGWGGGRGVLATTLTLPSAAAVQEVLSDSARIRRAHGGALVRGAGRSYGDAAHLRGGLVLDLAPMRRISLDAAAGVVRAEAAVTIGELLAHLVPRGFTMPVVPGTQHVSVGGAIASDIHGKNHGVAGTFGAHVLEIGLVDAAGQLRALTPGEADGLFEATLGGLGLTGAVVWARIAVPRASGSLLSVDTDRAGSLEEALTWLREPGGPHRVAWLDLLSRRVRGVVTRASQLAAAELGRATVEARTEVPAWWPSAPLRPASIRAFNALRFRVAPRRQRGAIEGFGAHMFPLDALAAWPRLYGGDGFLQYQFVVPVGQEVVVGEVIDWLRTRRVPIYLAVLKDMGPANGAPLSFPLEGWTLALDVPRAAPGLHRALDHCDELVAAAGGRVYLTKDARLRADMLEAMYPELGRWRTLRDAADPDRLWRSDLSQRIGLVAS